MPPGTEGSKVISSANEEHASCRSSSPQLLDNAGTSLACVRLSLQPQEDELRYLPTSLFAVFTAITVVAAMPP